MDFMYKQKSSYLVEQFLCDGQMPHVVLDGRRVILQQSVGVAQGVTRLSLDSSVSKLLRQLKCSLVLLSGSLELPQEDVRVAQVAVRASLGGLNKKYRTHFSL